MNEDVRIIGPVEAVYIQLFNKEYKRVHRHGKMERWARTKATKYAIENTWKVFSQRRSAHSLRNSEPTLG
jgi:hypothetical protein